MIKINDQISIAENEIEETFIRGSGPGGQNINKLSNAVQLRFDVTRSPSLPKHIKARLIELAGNRVTSSGELIIESKEHRSQDRNRHEAMKRLVELIRKAAEKPKRRRKTKPSAAAKKRRLENKRHRSHTKKLRKPIKHIEEQ